MEQQEMDVAKKQTDKFGREFVLKSADDLIQSDVAAWNRAYVQMSRVGLAEQRQAQLQAAIVAGWILTPEATVEKRYSLETGVETVVYLFDGVDVNQMKPAEVIWYGLQCDRLFVEATGIADRGN